MSHWLLVTKPHGQPVLIAQTGMTIEPEPVTGRSIITYPSKERVSAGMITVGEVFATFVESLAFHNLLIRVGDIPAKVEAKAEVVIPEEEPQIIVPTEITTLKDQREEVIIEVTEPFLKAKRERRKKA